MALTLTGLEGKVAVVTGAGRMRSIGRAIAVALARAGCDVVVTGTGRAPERYPEDEGRAGCGDIESVAAELRALGRRCLPLVSDVADLAAVRALDEAIQREWGRVDFIVNNAGAPRAGDREPVVAVDPAVWRRVFDINLHGSFYMSQVFGQRLIAQGEGGAIVNISSIGGKLLAPNTAAYAASKAAVQAMTAAMAGEVGQYGIRVNAVCPGIVSTSRLDDLPPAQWQDIVERYIPLRRAGRPDEIGAMVAYLCSDQGAWISGQLYSVDGGQLAGR